jgi:hypothetical protein
MRISFVPVMTEAEFARARKWAMEKGAQALQAGIPTWWIRGEDGSTLGITQKAMVPVLGLVLDPIGSARSTVAILDGLRNAAELSGENPLIITHADSAMNALHNRMLESAGDETRVYWFKKNEG